LLLCDLTAGARRLALVGLAKNTGKTVALAALLGELQAAGRAVGVTSVGRDGEEHDVIDFRIEKPAVNLWAGSLVATTDELLGASGIPHELLERTNVRTPLGRVLIARLRGAGAIEVAGPSASAEVRTVSDAMLAHGAEQVLIDGAVDRRAASSPEVSDGLLMCTGAVLSSEIGEVVERTREAVALVRLPALGDAEAERAARAGRSVLIAAEGEPVELPPRFALTGEAAAIARLLADHPNARRLVLAGALPEAFLAELARAAHRGGRTLEVVVGDATKIFLNERGPDWYARQGVSLAVLHAIELRALTVNPVAPQSHSFDSAALRGLLAEAIGGVPIFDVLHPQYRGAQERGLHLAEPA
jgi:hypothetical protein